MRSETRMILIQEKQIDSPKTKTVKINQNILCPPSTLITDCRGRLIDMMVRANSNYGMLFSYCCKAYRRSPRACNGQSVPNVLNGIQVRYRYSVNFTTKTSMVATDEKRKLGLCGVIQHLIITLSPSIQIMRFKTKVTSFVGSTIYSSTILRMQDS